MNAQKSLTQVGAFTQDTLAAIQANFTSLYAGLFQVGNIYYLDPLNGSDSAGTGAPNAPFQTLPVAYAACKAGNNDIVALVSDGATDSSARLTATLTWAKNATHLVGICSGVTISNRARIAPTATGTAFANFVVVSASGCLFQNVEIFQGFATGTTAQIALTVTGGRNLFLNCHVGGMGDAASAADVGSRNVKISGTGENQFVNCTIGLDTVARTNANASLEFAAATPRNLFRQCLFLMYAGSNAEFHILGTGAACIDREQIFDNCKFVNSIKSGATTVTAAASFTNAAPGGLLWFTGACASIGATKWGDTNALANSYVDGPVPTAGTSGLAVNPA